MDGEDRYVVKTYHRNADEYIRDSFSEEELDRFIKDKIIIHYPVNFWIKTIRDMIGIFESKKKYNREIRE